MSVKEAVKKEEVLEENVNSDKLLIMGFSPTSQGAAVEFLQKYPKCEMWCMNEFYSQAGFPFNLATRWFEIHHVPTNSSVNPGTSDGLNHRQNLRGLPIPLYVQSKERDWADFKRAVEFPADEIVKAFPRKYFTSTPTWLMAMAFLEGIKELKEKGKFKWTKIMLAGVDMMGGWNSAPVAQPDGSVKMVDKLSNEYANQRPSCEWIIGFLDSLKLLGIDCELIIPQESTLCKHNGLYGFEEYFKQDYVIEMKRRAETRNIWLQKRVESYQMQINAVQQKAQQDVMKLQQELLIHQGSKQENELELSFF